MIVLGIVHKSCNNIFPMGSHNIVEGIKSQWFSLRHQWLDLPLRKLDIIGLGALFIKDQNTSLVWIKTNKIQNLLDSLLSSCNQIFLYFPFKRCFTLYCLFLLSLDNFKICALVEVLMKQMKLRHLFQNYFMTTVILFTFGCYDDQTIMDSRMPAIIQSGAFPLKVKLT